MLSYAPRVYKDPARVARLEARLAQLLVQSHVLLLLSEGAQVTGVVAVQPLLQQYLDCKQRRGVNAIVRLDDPDRPMQQHVLWLDCIEQVQVLSAEPG